MKSATQVVILCCIASFLGWAATVHAQAPGNPGWELEVFFCNEWGTLHTGDKVTFQHGIGFGSYEEAVEQRAGESAIFSLDGHPLRPVYYEGLTIHHTENGEDFYGDRARVNWTATPGQHTVHSYWTHENEGLPGDTCTFFVNRHPRRSQ